jgi:hypothetical protein
MSDRRILTREESIELVEASAKVSKGPPFPLMWLRTTRMARGEGTHGE